MELIQEIILAESPRRKAMEFHFNFPVSRAGGSNATICLIFHNKKGPAIPGRAFQRKNDKRPLPNRGAGRTW